MVVPEASKILLKAEPLKEGLLAIKNVLVENHAVVYQQQLIETYRKVLFIDLEYGLDKKVEQDLWNHGFKFFIGSLQAIVKEKKNPKRTEAQAMLNWCLENTFGFYLTLLQDICSAYDLDLPFRKTGFSYGCTQANRLPKPSKRSIYYISQHCLVHLGDISRYQNQNRQAETFYKYALVLSPTSGQPYNQLAILEASRGDKLSAVFYYVRAVALSHPFPAAATNLSRALDKHMDDVVKIEGHGRLSSHEYLAAFLKLHGVLHCHSQLEDVEKLVQILITSLTAHIATESLSSWKLIQMVTINIFALNSVTSDGADNKDLTESEMEVANMVTHLIAGTLNAFLLPVYTIKEQEPLLEYFAMPAIKLTLELIRVQPNLLSSLGFAARRQIWPSLCRLLNQLQISLKDFQPSQYAHMPLPEDRDLQGFLPLEKSFQPLMFHTDDFKTDSDMLNKIRAARLLDFGKWLTEQTPQFITMSSTAHGVVEFETIGQPELPKDLIQEIEELNLGNMMSPIHSDSSGSATGTSTPDSSSIGNILSSESLPEKKGILKSEILPDKPIDSKPSVARGSRNVALTAIMNQKISDDVKQVTFKTPSPTKEKPAKALSAAKKVTHQNQSPKNKEEKSPAAESEHKQKALSALLSETGCQQPQAPTATSGLLNLSRQQQELLTNSKQSPPQPTRTLLNPRPPPAHGQQRVAEKMEVARKEYEDAMMQQRKLESTEPVQFRGNGEQFRFERMMQVPPPQMFMPANQAPVMGMHPMPMPPMQPYPFNVQPGMMVPWQESEQLPPMPPASWWTEQPHMMQGRDPMGFRPPQPPQTYSLFSNPLGTEPNPNMLMADRVFNQQQSFWSGPGPSPLERLLEQQRNQVKNHDHAT